MTNYKYDWLIFRSMTQRRTLIIVLTIFVFLVLQPLYLFFVIRSYISGYRNDAGYGISNTGFINERFVPTVKWDLFNSRNNNKNIFIIGNSSSFYYSKERFEEVLGCDVGEYLNMSV